MLHDNFLHKTYEIKNNAEILMDSDDFYISKMILLCQVS